MQGYLALVELVRPLNVVIAFVSVLLGGWMSGARGVSFSLLMAGASGALIAGAANALNDLCDEEEDRINRPGRPIPSGRVTRREAMIASGALFVVGWGLAGWVGTALLVLALGVSILLILYDFRLKRITLWGNLAVGFAGGLAFVYGGLAVGRPIGALVPAGFACLFHLGREIVKDAEDISGDREAGAMTLPVRWGPRTTVACASGTFGLLIPLTFVPFWLGLYGWLYLVIVVLGVDLVLVYVILSMWRDHSPSNLRRVSIVLKADMIVGLGAILAGRLY